MCPDMQHFKCNENPQAEYTGYKASINRLLMTNTKDNKKSKSNWPSMSGRSIGPWLASDTAWCLDDLAPLNDMIKALSRAKLSLQRIQFTVGLYSSVPFLADHRGKSPVECSSSSTRTSSSWHNKWGESCMFHFTYPLLILPFFFLLLLSPIYGCEWTPAIWLGTWVKNPDV